MQTALSQRERNEIWTLLVDRERGWGNRHSAPPKSAPPDRRGGRTRRAARHGPNLADRCRNQKRRFGATLYMYGTVNKVSQVESVWQMTPMEIVLARRR